MNIFVKRASQVAGFVVMAGVTVVSQSPLKLDFIRNAEAWVRAPVATVAVVSTVAVSSANQKAAASANQQAAAANQQAAASATASANAAAASANAAAAAAKAPAPAGAPPVGTIVTALPPGCAPTKLNGVDYQRCGTTYYTVAMMGSNLVFVVAQP